MKQTIKGMDFEHEMKTTSHIFGRDADVQVVFEGDKAQTDGNVIILPALDQTADIDTAAASVARGFVDHEAAHLRYTEFDYFEKMKKRYGEMGQMIINAIEDVRISRLTIDNYVGAKDNMNATCRAVDEKLLKGFEGGEFKDRPGQDFLPLSITWTGYQRMGMGRGDECLAHVEEDVRKLAEQVDAKVPDLKDTKGAYDLAEWVCKELKLKEEEQDEEGDGDGEGEGEESDGEGGGKGKEGATKWEFDKANPVGLDGGGAVSEILREFAGGSKRTYLGPVEQDNMLTAETKPYNHASQWHHNAFKRGRSTWHRQHAQTTTRGGIVHAVKRRLEAMLFSETERGWNPAQEVGRLDSKRLTQAVMGHELVFKTRRGLPDIDTAVSVLVDMSGSMSGQKIMLATQVATLLSEALHKTGVAFEIAGFHNISHHFTRKLPLPPAMRKVDWDQVLRDYPTHTEFSDERSYESFNTRTFNINKVFSRIQPMDYVTFKEWGERLSDARPAIQAMVNMAGGNNSDGDALMEQYRRLRKRREKRRIMMVLSDGAPACGDGEASHLQKVTAMIEADKDVELVGIGICDSSVKHFYAKHAVCHRLEDLSTTVMDELQEALVRGRKSRVKAAA